MSPAPVASKQPLGTPPEVAAYLGGVAEKTLANWRSAGKGPEYIKTGGLVRYRWSAVEAWLAEQTKAETA